MVQKRFAWNSVVVVTQIGPETRQHAKVLRDIRQRLCNWGPKQTAISLSSCEAEFYTASACAGKLGLAALFKELHYGVSVRLEMDSDSARHILQRRCPGGLQHNELRCLATQQWIREKRLSASRVETKNNSADLFTKHLDVANTVACEETWVSNPGWYEWYRR